MKRAPRGTGSVFFRQDKGVWVCKTPYRCPLTGRTKHHAPTFETESLARDRWREVLQGKVKAHPKAGEIERRLGLPIPEEALGFPAGSMGRIYLAFLFGPWKDELAPHTFANRLSRARRHVLPHIGKTPLPKVDPPCLFRLFEVLKPTLGVPTRGDVRRDLHAFFERIGPFGLRLVESNPVNARALKLERHEEREKAILDPAEFARTVQTIAGLIEDRLLPLPLESTAAMFLTSLATSAAKGECRPLKWDAWNEKEGGLRILGTKNRYRRRAVPVPESLAEVFRILKGRASSLYLFPSEKLGPLPDRSVNRQFENLKLLVGLPESMTFADARSTYRSIMDGRAGARTIMEIMGHAKASTGDQHYARGIDDYKKQAAEVIEELVAG